MNAEVLSLARTAASSFEVATREDGTEYTRRKEDAPTWLQELVFEAHGDMLPDDWRYACIAAACEAIADGTDDAHDFADPYVDVYTADLYEWLSSNLTRQGYCDDADREYGADTGIVERIQVGQYEEAREVFEAVKDWLYRQMSPARIESAQS